jgi:hypothetical protein
LLAGQEADEKQPLGGPVILRFILLATHDALLEVKRRANPNERASQDDEWRMRGTRHFDRANAVLERRLDDYWADLSSHGLAWIGLPYLRDARSGQRRGRHGCFACGTEENAVCGRSPRDIPQAKYVKY